MVAQCHNKNTINKNTSDLIDDVSDITKHHHLYTFLIIVQKLQYNDKIDKI